MINVAEILPANLPTAWTGEETNALAIATALSQKAGKTLPWKTVKDVIGASLNARFTQLADGSAPWPCDLPAAQTVKLKVAPAGPGGGTGGGGTGTGGTAADNPRGGGGLRAVADSGSGRPDSRPARIEGQVQGGNEVPCGSNWVTGKTKPSDAVVKEVNTVIKDLDSGFRVA